MMENGLIPSSSVFKELVRADKKYEYLQYLTDLNQYLKGENYTLAEFK